MIPPSILEELQKTSARLNTAIERRQEKEIRVQLEKVKIIQKFLEEILANFEIKDFENLTRHMRFVEYYLKNGDFEMMKSNSEDIVERDLPRLFSDLRKRDQVSEKEKSPEILLYKDLRLHPRIKEASKSLFESKHYAQSIFEAHKELGNFVRERSGVNDYGQSLMSKVFKKDNPILKINELETDSDEDEQEGFMFLFMGAMRGIRNPKAHDRVIQEDPYRALKYIAFASLLAERVEESEKA